jgi:hypothetical protein
MRQTRSSISSAKCYCGAVNIQFANSPISIVHCHCSQCRRLSGAAFTTWVSFAKLEMRLEGGDFISKYNASPNVCRHFCRSCGSHVYTLDARDPEIIGVPVGVLEGELSMEPKAHYFVDHKSAWLKIGDTLRQYGGDSGFEPTTIKFEENK